MPDDDATEDVPDAKEKSDDPDRPDPLKLLDLGRHLDPDTDLDETRRRRRSAEEARDRDLKDRIQDDPE